MDETLLSIGELAARSGLSPKALRLYDESGLLVPRRVDPFTGYRSYGADQVERARLIAALRGLGMGLARIHVLCDLDADAASAELRSWWRQEEADALSRAAAVRSLAHDLGELPTEDVMTTSSTTARAHRPRTASALHQGLVRPAQQDAVLVREMADGRTLLAVADGFGTADDLAERILAAFASALEEGLPQTLGTVPGGEALTALETAWAAAEALVPADGAEPADGAADGAEPAGGPSGSTLTAALLDGDRLHVGHLGDTRVVLARGERIDQVTQDHTQVRSLLEAGRLSPAEAATHPDRAVLNRALAAGAPTAPDLLVRRLEPGDLVLVATDGLHAVVDPSALAGLLTGDPDGSSGDLEALAAALVERAMRDGGPDNIALALARV